MEKKLTAVEWLKSVTLDSNKSIYRSDLEKLFTKAKQMEREQIEDAFESGHMNCLAEKAYRNGIVDPIEKTASDYFTQTYQQ